MLLFKRSCLAARGSPRIQPSALSSRTIFHKGFSPKYRWRSSKASHATGWDPQDDFPAPWSLWAAGALSLSVLVYTAWRESQPFRHSVLAVIRCSRVAGKVIYCGSRLIKWNLFARCCCLWRHRLQNYLREVVRDRGSASRGIFKMPQTQCREAVESFTSKWRRVQANHS